MTNQIMSDYMLVAIAMIEKSQVLSTVQQIKLRRLELELDALREQIECKCNTKQKSLVEKEDSLVNVNS